MAVTLSGSARVDFGDLPTMAGLTAISACFTIAIGGSVTGVRFFTQWGSSAGTQALLIDRSSNNIRMIVNGDAGQRSRTTNDNPLETSTLHRIVCRWNNSGALITCMVNGVARSMGSASGTNPATTKDATSSVQLGHQTSENQNAIAGDYSEAALFGRYLTDEEAVAYGKGFSPAMLGPGNRILYARLLTTGDVVNQWSGAAGSLTGGSAAIHPAMLYPVSGRARRFTTAAAAGRTGTLAATLAALTAAAAGTVAITGAVSQTLGALTAAATGTVADPGAGGDGAGALFMHHHYAQV